MGYRRLYRDADRHSPAEEKPPLFLSGGFDSDTEEESYFPYTEEAPQSEPLDAQSKETIRQRLAWAKDQPNFLESLSHPAVIPQRWGKTVPVQAKLTIGPANDHYEQQADQVADQVVEQINSPTIAQSPQEPSVNRQEDTEETALQPQRQISTLQRSPAFSALQRELMQAEERPQPNFNPMRSSPGKRALQRELMRMEERPQPRVKIQRRAETAEGEASADLTAAIDRERGGGRPLDPRLRASMGQAMGADFSGVRVHTDGQADELNQAIQAKAFTTGQDVFFRRGEYNPGSRGGQGLIAHELTHVVQQNGGIVTRDPQMGATQRKEIELDKKQPTASERRGEERNTNRIRKENNKEEKSIQQNKLTEETNKQQQWPAVKKKGSGSSGAVVVERMQNRQQIAPRKNKRRNEEEGIEQNPEDGRKKEKSKDREPTIAEGRGENTPEGGFLNQERVVQRTVDKTNVIDESDQQIGKMNYSFRWQTSEPHNNGYILQNINRKEFITKRDNTTDRTEKDYWEAWQVKENKIYDGNGNLLDQGQHDSWFNAEMPKGTFGSIIMEGDVWFTRAPLETMMRVRGVEDAAGLLSSYNKPDCEMEYQPGLRHTFQWKRLLEASTLETFVARELRIIKDDSNTFREYMEETDWGEEEWEEFATDMIAEQDPQTDVTPEEIIAEAKRQVEIEAKAREEDRA